MPPHDHKDHIEPSLRTALDPDFGIALAHGGTIDPGIVPTLDIVLALCIGLGFSGRSPNGHPLRPLVTNSFPDDGKRKDVGEGKDSDSHHSSSCSLVPVLL